MYVLFGGTTDYLSEFKAFLLTVPHTLLEGTSGWQAFQLKAQVVVFFNLEDAKAAQAFLINECHQKDAPLYEIHSHKII